MTVRLTVLCENTVGRPLRVVGEHGFACFVECPSGNFLFDTGQGLGIQRNAQVLGKDLASLRGILLSHGHHDHTGGLVEVLSQTGQIDIFAHPEIFAERYWSGHHEMRSIGMPFEQRLLEEIGGRFRWCRGFSTVAPGLSLSGEVPRPPGFAVSGDPHLVIPNGRDDFVPDPLRDDLSLVIDTPRGLVVLLGCAHAGLVNILSHVLEKTGRDSIHALVGGMHLAPLEHREFEGTLEAIEEAGVEKLYVSHCTGQQRSAQLHEHFPGRVFFASVGTTLEI